MEKKIIKLLNKFENEGADAKIRYWNYYQNGFHLLEYGQTYSELLMISKKYGFIKWLVENDKVRIPHELDELPAMYGYDYDSAECKADRLLMLLAIQDSPLELLADILK